jgi:hypothetical protein
MYKHMLDSTCGVLFFGAPQQGMETADLEYLIDCELDGRTLASKMGLVSLLQKVIFFCKFRIIIYRIPYGINLGGGGGGSSASLKQRIRKL